MTRLLGEGRSSTALLKRVLLSLLVVGLLGSVTAKRVYAVFVTESTNTGSTVASGTFTMEVGLGSNSACRSIDGAFVSGPPTVSNNNTCTDATGQLFASTPRYPGDANTVNVTVRNTGSIDSQDLKVSLTCANASAGNGPNPCTDLNNASHSVTRGLEFFIQETYANGTPIRNGCLYPDANPDVPAVGTQYPVCAGPYWEPESFVNFPKSPSCWDLGRVRAGATRYFTVGLQWAGDADNSYQGQSARFGLSWHMDSADRADGSLSVAHCVND